MSRPAKASSLSSIKVGRRRIIGLVVLLLLLYAVVPQLGQFRSSFEVVKHGQLDSIVIAVALATITSPVATAIYMLLAKKRLRFGRTLMIQFASLFTNRLLPAGLGSLGLNFEYLRRQRHNQAEAGAVVAASALLGFVGNILLLGIVIPITHVSSSQLVHLHFTKLEYWLAAGALVIIAVVLVLLRKLRNRLWRITSESLLDIAGYLHQPWRLAGATVVSMGLTSLYTLCLGACAAAVGVHLSFSQALIISSIGVVGSTITPTPGGLVGAEAALFAGLVAYKAPSAEALAVVLIYRFITYWLALAFGAVAWIFIRRRNYI